MYHDFQRKQLLQFPCIASFISNKFFLLSFLFFFLSSISVSYGHFLEIDGSFLVLNVRINFLYLLNAGPGNLLKATLLLPEDTSLQSMSKLSVLMQNFRMHSLFWASVMKQQLWQSMSAIGPITKGPTLRLDVFFSPVRNTIIDINFVIIMTIIVINIYLYVIAFATKCRANVAYVNI